MRLFARVTVIGLMLGISGLLTAVYGLSYWTGLSAVESVGYARSELLQLNDQHCLTSLQHSGLTFTPAPIQSTNRRCEQPFAVSANSIGDVTIVGSPPVSCRVARALVKYANEVQPIAQEYLGQRIKGIEHKGTYNCRSIRNRPGVMSQHATANAIDISGFRLEDGSTVRLGAHWKGSGAKSRFLYEAHKVGCSVFNLGLGPDYDALHRGHFHYDMGMFRGCK